MKPFYQLIRLLKINHILAKNGLDQVIVSLRLFRPFRFVIYFNPWNWFRPKTFTRGEALRQTLEELGPIFVKFGQALSTRPDIVPPDIAAELSKLQDKVPPFSSEEAMSIVEKELGRPIDAVFEQFDCHVLASASVAQVHAAKLKTGEDVVVKIIRPTIRPVVKQDLSIIKTMASLADRYWPQSRRFKPREIVQEFQQNLFDELDLRREAANASQLRRNFMHSPLLYVPEIYWDYASSNMLVMERIHGIPVTDVDALRNHNINIKKLAERGLEIFFTQVFRDCFFHADMHPGNIFVSPNHPEDPQYICVDFGIMGTLSDEDKRYLAENLFAFFNRDYRRVAQLHVESGWVARDTRIDVFESAIRLVCEPIFEKPLKDISFAWLVLRLFQVARRFQMEVQPQLVLLQKTLLAIEGLGRQLYPELDLWVTAKPYLEKWMRQQVGVKALVRRVHENIPFLMEQLPYMPRLLHDVLTLQKEQLYAESQRLSQYKKTDIRSARQWYKGMGLGIFISMLTVSALLFWDEVARDHMLAFTLGTGVLGGLAGLAIRRPSTA